MKMYLFSTEGTGWYIMAKGKKEVTRFISRMSFHKADHLELVEVCSPAVCGGYYVLHTYKQQLIEYCMWLYIVINFVFGGC
jgi:hypothetical protein